MAFAERTQRLSAFNAKGTMRWVWFIRNTRWRWFRRRRFSRSRCYRRQDHRTDRGSFAKGAKLIAFPETFIPGYPWQIWLGAPTSTIGRGFVQRYFDNSLAFNSPQAEKIRNAVKRAKLTAVLGLSNATAAVYISRNG